MRMAKNNVPSGIIALVLLTVIYGFTAVMARFFSESVGIFEQWYLRFLIALLIMLVVFRKKIKLAKFMQASSTELWLVVVRGFVGFVVAAGLYALSTQLATIGSVSVMQVVPTTALLGVLLLHERVNKKVLSLIGLSFLGAVLVALRNIGDLHFGLGEIVSLISGALFSLTFVLRKKQTGELNNYELAFGTTVVGFLGNYILAAIFENAAIPDKQVFDSSLGLLFIGAGVLSVAMSLLSSYGFEHVKATTAAVILDMELVFGVVLGYLIYQEILTPIQSVGAAIILFAALCISYLETGKRALLPSAPS